LAQFSNQQRWVSASTPQLLATLEGPLAVCAVIDRLWSPAVAAGTAAASAIRAWHCYGLVPRPVCKVHFGADPKRELMERQTRIRL
jgi:hypothetical protein